MKNIGLISLLTILLFSCQPKTDHKKGTQEFLDTYSKKYQELYFASAQTEWKSNTEIIEGDTVNGTATQKANEFDKNK